MNRNFSAILLTFCFLLITLAPSVSILSENNFDLIQLLDASEEEEKNTGKNFEKDIVVYNLHEALCPYQDLTNNLRGEYIKSDYPKPHPNLLSPPPEHYF